MKIPVGTREIEEETHHYVHKKRVSEPVYLEVPLFPLFVSLMVLLLIIVDRTVPVATPPTTVNIQINEGE